MRHDTVTKPPSELVYLDALYVGRRFRSGTHALDERQILAFAREFDPQPFHTDREAAKGTLFRGLAASGWHTAAITMRLQVDGGLPIAGGIVGLGGEVSWPTATRPGDVLHVESEILGVVPSRSRPDRGTVTVRSETRNQRGEVVQTATIKLLVPRHSRPDAGPSTATGFLREPVSPKTRPEGRVGSYVIALSQTDTAEQAEWMHALETRPSTDEARAAQRREHERT
jgi:acyl dehydratase